MKTEFKIYASLAVLAALGGGYALTRSNANAERDKRSVSVATADLPSINVSEEDSKNLTKIEVTMPDKEKEGTTKTVTLEKKGDDWSITAPFAAKATQADVETLLKKLKDLKTKDIIDRANTHYADYDLDDAKAIHFVAYKGTDKALDLYFGRSGTRGQVVRVGGKDGVYIAEGFDALSFGKDAKGWRDKTVLKLKDDEIKDAESVQIDNANGEFVFVKKDGKWHGTFAKLGKDGQPRDDDKLTSPDKVDDKPDDKKDADKKADKKPDDKKDADKKADKKSDDKKDADKDKDKKDDKKKGVWSKFDGDKVEDLLKPFKTLNAVDYADADAKPADTGLNDPKAQGGVIVIKLKSRTITLDVGKVQKGKNRFAVLEGGDPTVVVLSSWAADWAVADTSKFEKAASPPPGGPGKGPPPPMPGDDDGPDDE